MPKLHLFTFAADNRMGGIRYKLAAEYVKSDAEEFNLFDSITIKGEDDLITDDNFQDHIPFVIQNPRGFGYWIWKPYLILKKLNEINEGEILLYLDACTLLNKRGKARFEEYVQRVLDNPEHCLFFKNNQKIGHWCKMDLLHNYESESLIQENDMIAAVMFIQKTPENLRFFEMFYTSACTYSHIDDSPSVLPNLEIFKEHRHDQSLFTLLAYKYRPLSVLHSIPISEIYSSDKSEMKYAPIRIQANFY
ncbi:MAG: hypothetical protein ACKOPU_04635 [Candidatus Planktophila sp.]